MACITFPNILAPSQQKAVGFPPNTQATKPTVLGSQENHLLNFQVLVFTILDSTVGTVTTLWVGQWGGRFEFWQGQEIFLFSEISKTAMGPNPAS